MLDCKIIKFETLSKGVNEITNLIPPIQRDISNDHVKEIYDYQNKCFEQNSFYIIASTISIVHVIEDHCSYLIDGQHRLAAYKQLLEAYPDRGIKINTDNYTVNEIKDVDFIYKNVNTHNENPITKLSIDEYKILEDIKKYFNENFNEYIPKSNSKNPYRPNINLDKIITFLKEKEIIIKCNIQTSSDLIGHIQKLNTFYSNHLKKESKTWHIKIEALDKIDKNSSHLYLGMYPNGEWIDRMIDHLNKNIPYDKMKHYDSTFRVTITRDLKRSVWDSELSTQNCYCCQEIIYIDTFECGHVIPLCRGGPTNKNNLRPICHDCNQDMKTMDMDEYIKLKKESL